MRWNRVTIIDGAVAEVETSALIQAYAAAFRRAGRPPRAAIFHRQGDAGHRLYFFSPEASAVGFEMLRAFEATPCTKPDPEKLKRVRI